MRFQLIDRITSLVPNESITAVKNVSIAEEYLADHFPGFPVLPGVFMLEALTQTGAWLMRASTDFSCSTILLKETRALKYNAFVAPGDQLQLSMKVKKIGPQHWEFAGSGVLASTQESAVSARIVLTQFNVADRDPSARASDEARIVWLRQLFPTLWSAAPAGQELAS
ncbi:Beta-hydroxyacyl-(acyl-carrier-protein) dehydratase FabA/FabZ [Planctopirus limnophila DSM 3776]|uniref:Beta-hydroxyacyl-(Acyl-carrier-protein) dehydratase FabA/FabZ n=1 Tax=Planctopirus limnophila (strain ATCC 43296 / DSM 3776 / IFAM 1008 / Mu 290) TaxID=521674 RepID=D5SSY8_PLAL2|nr:3-hydroxyacyl-ACP dehydratase FabZ family protein [Planctopirus limnophila]ADG68939.1 Beta-hydroxyacyl-(acyl-carrier-protein) dehydratase FabA/FabZ [Planctopirus limnophila DSM 3776]